MGLFDFLKNAGKKVPSESDMAAELQKSVLNLGLGIKDLHVAFDRGVATMRGEAASHKDKELARLVVGNHEGVEKVNDDGLIVAPQPAQNTQAAALDAMQRPMAAQPTASPSPSPTMTSHEARMYTVKPGDTLSKIAKEQLGDSSRYPALFEANKPMIKDPNEIYPGQVIRIP